MNGKIINDPVYGFLHFPEKEMMQIINHHYFQRLRHIKQMGIAHFVYPGAVHTRFHHSLGAAHLMGIALNNLRLKGIDITPQEYIAARQAILLHDVGHGAFSHALEYSLVADIKHEDISLSIMQYLHREGVVDLSQAIAIFRNEYPKNFLGQLVSGQLDMDRMDYLNRDSFYTGVSEGVIGYDRILQMLFVLDNHLVVEEKAIYSVEKFLIARRMMYWQVYLHKTVLGAEQLIIKILKRAKELAMQGKELFATPALKFFLYENITGTDFSKDSKILDLFCHIDDTDISASIKTWMQHEDKTLSILCSMMLHRQLYKVKLKSHSLTEEFNALWSSYTLPKGIEEEQKPYFIFNGTTSNSTYNLKDKSINIYMKDGSLVTLSEVDNALIGAEESAPLVKHYYCLAKI